MLTIILGVHWRIQLLGGEVHEKPIYRGGLPKKGEMDKLQIKRGAYQEKGGGFEGGGVIPQYTLCYYKIIVSANILSHIPFMFWTKGLFNIRPGR